VTGRKVERKLQGIIAWSFLSSLWLAWDFGGFNLEDILVKVLSIPNHMYCALMNREIWDGLYTVMGLSMQINMARMSGLSLGCTNCFIFSEKL
jgi:hypothetical protein